MRCIFCSGEVTVPSPDTYQLVRQFVRTDTKDGATLRQYDEWYACRRCVNAKQDGVDPDAPTLFDTPMLTTTEVDIRVSEAQFKDYLGD